MAATSWNDRGEWQAATAENLPEKWYISPFIRQRKKTEWKSFRFVVVECFTAPYYIRHSGSGKRCTPPG